MLLPYTCLAIICSGQVPFEYSLPLWALTGAGLAGIGFNVGHDAIHGAISSHKWLNKVMGWSFDLMGAGSYAWVASHNFAHHTYTNIPTADPDIEPGPLLTFYDKDKVPWFHRFQHIYAWAAYCFLSFLWIVERDFTFLLRPDPRNGKKGTLKQLARVVALKSIYVGIFVVLPLKFSGFTVLQFIIGFAIMHAVTGIALAVIFQLAHVVIGVDRPYLPAGKSRMETPWAEHQVRTTANFGKTQICTFLFGGLNYQIEHHLFPHVCHIHYPKIAPLVEACAKEHGLPYVHSGSFFEAVASHQRALYRFGHPEQVRAVVEMSEPQAQQTARAA
ncbi:MAG: acyl-CoA desaturase [Deltaproteobacteria bacterium]|nr:acyl-CoA desaturase [Deltaproteobacteria bacterium]